MKNTVENVFKCIKDNDKGMSPTMSYSISEIEKITPTLLKNIKELEVKVEKQNALMQTYMSNQLKVDDDLQENGNLFLDISTLHFDIDRTKRNIISNKYQINHNFNELISNCRQNDMSISLSWREVKIWWELENNVGLVD